MPQIADLVIVIPTLNEEKYIGYLLQSLADQTVQPREIVVVDAHSEDQTALVVKSYRNKLPQLKFYLFPRSTISHQRNFGVKKSRSSSILFLDADMVLADPNTLKIYLQEVKERKAELAAAFNQPLSDYWKDRLFFWGMNWLFRLMLPIWPIATGANLYIKRRVFVQLNGFDENIKVGEDVELVQRVIKAGFKFVFLERPKLYTSVRRLRKEGRLYFVLKMIRSFLNVQRWGFANNPINYQFGIFNEDIKGDR